MESKSVVSATGNGDAVIDVVQPPTAGDSKSQPPADSKLDDEKDMGTPPLAAPPPKGAGDDTDSDADDEEEGDGDPMGALKDTVQSFKKLIGMEDEPKPADGEWIDLYKTDFKTKKREFRGRVLISLEIMPKTMADKLPAGLGRSEPNANPYLPAPVGRLKFVSTADLFIIFLFIH